MFVKEFGLLSTTFRTTTNSEIVAPNAMLATQKYIYNSRRSGAQWEFTLIQVGFETSLETLDQLRTKLRAWTKENDRDFGGPLDVNFNSITQQNAIELVVAFEQQGHLPGMGVAMGTQDEADEAHQDGVRGAQHCLLDATQPITFQPKSCPAPFRLGNATSLNDAAASATAAIAESRPQRRYYFLLALHPTSAASLNLAYSTSLHCIHRPSVLANHCILARDDT